MLLEGQTLIFLTYTKKVFSSSNI